MPEDDHEYDHEYGAATTTKDAESGVFRSTRSRSQGATSAARRKYRLSGQAEVAADDIIATRNSSDDATATATISNDGNRKFIRSKDSGVFRSTRSAIRRKSLADAVQATTEVAIARTGTGTLTGTTLSVDDGTCSDSSNTRPPALSLPSPPSSPCDVNDTPSSKGSLQSLWDVLHCGGRGERAGDDDDANIVSRCGSCVNPMASTLMNMWREEEAAAAIAAEQEGEQASYTNNTETDNGHDRDQYYDHAHDPTTVIISATTTIDDKDNNHESDDDIGIGFCCWNSPPRKTFSSDLNLVYGLDRVQNLTLARPKALPARTTSSSSLSSPTMASSHHPRLFACLQ